MRRRIFIAVVNLFAVAVLADALYASPVISDFCGFENPNSLRKFFKAQTGKTMSEWRSGNLS
ncbi:MAG: AraC family transcriptional regulator [Kiritimatiellae bacterium]|nr:AraC family transcriptional regulator [Kiritimatiellia bacterium]